MKSFHHYIIYLVDVLIFLFLFSTFKPITADDATEEEKQIVEWKKSRVVETKEGWHFPFEVDQDNNKFPDNWSRTENYKLSDGKTLALASWADISLDNKTKKFGKTALHILFEGAGKISLETDKFQINNFAAYEVSSWMLLDSESTKNTTVTLGVKWYDEDGAILPSRTEDAMVIKHTLTWERFKQRINILHEKASYAQLYIMVDGSDKKGNIWIDEILFYKRPRITIETGKKFHTFDEKELFKISVNMKGLEKPKYFLDVHMTNAFDDLVYNKTEVLDLSKLNVEDRKQYSFNIFPVSKNSFVDPARSERNYLIKGVFKVSILLRDDIEEIGGNNIQICRTNMRIRKPLKEDGEIFGVTVESVNKSSMLRDGLKILGALKVKIPIWHSELEVDGNQFVNNSAKNNVSNLLKEVKSGENQPTIIGMFGPRPEILKDIAEPGILNLIAGDATIWNPYFKATIESFGSRVDEWQLGDDFDTSFKNDDSQAVNLENLSFLDKIMNQRQLGGTTMILTDPSITDKVLKPHKWLKYFNFIYDNNFDFDKLRMAMSIQPKRYYADRWLTIPVTSINNSEHALDPAIEMFKKIVLARKNDISRIFVRPYQDEFSGLINNRNEITPSFLAMKLAIDELSEVSYMGSLEEFGDDVDNFVFSLKSNPKKAILVTWTKRSDFKQKDFQFTEKILIRTGKNFEETFAELMMPDKYNGFTLDKFVPDFYSEKNYLHLFKSLNEIINNEKVRNSFIDSYINLVGKMDFPELDKLLSNNYKSEIEEQKTARYLLETLYDNLARIEVVQKDILLDQAVEKVDLLGNSTPVQILFSKGDKVPYQEIKIDQYPSIFTGLNRDFINTRISIKLDTSKKLYSRLVKQKQAIIIKNHYDQPMDGFFIINYPLTWKNFNPVLKFHLDKGEEKTLEYYVIPSRIAEPGPITIDLKTQFQVDSKYIFKSFRQVVLESDLIVGKPNEEIEIIPPRFGDSVSTHQLNLPIGLKPSDDKTRSNEIDVVVTLDLPGDFPIKKQEKIQENVLKVINFPIKIKKEYKNKKAKIRIEQRGGNSDSMIFHNLEIPIPDE